MARYRIRKCIADANNYYPVMIEFTNKEVWMIINEAELKIVKNKVKDHSKIPTND